MTAYKKYSCDVCGHIYDEAEGDPEADIAAGTLWADLPSDWVCPICGAEKSEFELID
ncbi:MAG: rubredoxin [Methylococcaceae bacterium]